MTYATQAIAIGTYGYITSDIITTTNTVIVPGEEYEVMLNVEELTSMLSDDQLIVTLKECEND
jgi:hypothetical protein